MMVDAVTLKEIAKAFDDSDVPSKDRMMVVQIEGWRRLLWMQAPWWKKLIVKVCPSLLSHDWGANTDGESMEWKDGCLFNYLVCGKCGDVTDSFDIASNDEFAKRYRRAGCLGVRDV